jgi:hypothetical protein
MASTLTIKARTKQEIADLLGISTDTLRRRLKEKKIDIPTGLLSPHDQKRIFDALWYPDHHAKEDYDIYC